MLDLVAFYPPQLWAPPGAPLHFLVALRRHYVSSTGDPFFAATSAAHAAPWFQAFLYIEGLVQFPLAAYLVSQLSSARRMGGPAELAGLAFGCLTFMGSAACCYELLHMGPGEVEADKKDKLLYGTYLPFVVIRKFAPCYKFWIYFAKNLSRRAGCRHVSAAATSRAGYQHKGQGRIVA